MISLRSRLRKYLLIAAAIVGLFVLCTTILAISGLYDQMGKADVGLVLGSKVELDGSPSPRLRARLDRTVELYWEGYFSEVIVSGGVGQEGYDEAQVMRDYLASHGIPAEHILMDSGGATTYDSARNTVQIARQRGFKSIFVISQYFHLPRACMALRRFGAPEVYCAHAHFFELRDVYSTARELAGYVSYLFRDYDGGVGNHA